MIRVQQNVSQKSSQKIDLSCPVFCADCTSRPGARPLGAELPLGGQGCSRNLEVSLALHNLTHNLPIFEQLTHQSSHLLIGHTESVGDFACGLAFGLTAEVVNNLPTQSIVGNLRLGRLALSGVLLRNLRTQSGELFDNSVIGNSVDSNIESGNIGHLRHGQHHPFFVCEHLLYLFDDLSIAHRVSFVKDFFEFFLRFFCDPLAHRLYLSLDNKSIAYPFIKVNPQMKKIMHKMTARRSTSFVQNDGPPGRKMRGAFLPLSLAPSFQPSASRACAYVACTFVYRKGGLRLAVVGLCRGRLTRSPCELLSGSAPFPHLVIELQHIGFQLSRGRCAFFSSFLVPTLLRIGDGSSSILLVSSPLDNNSITPSFWNVNPFRK